MGKKLISASALVSLKEALTYIYWYKEDLRSFLINILTDVNILSHINWKDYKRKIVSNIIDFLARNQDRYQRDLLQIMSEVSQIDDFSHLSQLEDGEKKARKAKIAVSALRKLTKAHEILYIEQEKIEERRKRTYEKLLKTGSVKEKLEQLTKEYSELLRSNEPQKRGYMIESILRELFALFDLDPKASFKIKGEQIDGAFSFEGTDYLLEVKWQTEPVNASTISSLLGKLSGRLENSLGLFLSINGFSPDAVKIHSSGRRLIILMDGSDLMAVLDRRIDLVRLLLRKRRCASQTGNIYLKVHEIL